MRIEPGATLAARELRSVRGERLRIPDPTHLVHLQLRRFAGCPVCSLHLRSIARRHEEIRRAGVVEVAVFHSPPEMLREHDDLPFAVVADPEKVMYRELGVGRSLRAVLHPRVFWAAARGFLGRRPSVVTMVRGGPLGKPADFLVAPDGRVLACKYGEHADDHWSVDEILVLAARHGGRAEAAVADA